MTEGFLCNAMAAYGSAVYRLALCRTQSVPDAEDVYQDVFLRLLDQEAEGWDNERLKAWLLRAAINKCKNLHRAKRSEEVPMPPQFPAPAEVDGSVLDEVRALPEPYRNAIYLHYFEGYTAKEIGEILGIKRNTVLSWLSRGRQALRARMIGGFEDE